MKKETFKSLRSQYRKLERDAFRSVFYGAFCNSEFLRDEYSERLKKSKSKFCAENNLGNFDFDNFSKPRISELIVARKTFAHLGYPFSKIKERKWN